MATAEAMVRICCPLGQHLACFCLRQPRVPYLRGNDQGIVHPKASEDNGTRIAAHRHDECGERTGHGENGDDFSGPGLMVQGMIRTWIRHVVGRIVLAILPNKVGSCPGVLGGRRSVDGPGYMECIMRRGDLNRVPIPSSSGSPIDTPGPGRRVVDGAGPWVAKGWQITITVPVAVWNRAPPSPLDSLKRLTDPQTPDSVISTVSCSPAQPGSVVRAPGIGSARVANLRPGPVRTRDGQGQMRSLPDIS